MKNAESYENSLASGSTSGRNKHITVIRVCAASAVAAAVASHVSAASVAATGVSGRVLNDQSAFFPHRLKATLFSHVLVPWAECCCL